MYIIQYIHNYLNKNFRGHMLLNETLHFLLKTGKTNCKTLKLSLKLIQENITNPLFKSGTIFSNKVSLKYFN